MRTPSTILRVLVFAGLGIAAMSFLSIFFETWFLAYPWGIDLKAGLIQISKIHYSTPVSTGPPFGLEWSGPALALQLPSIFSMSKGDFVMTIPLWLPLAIVELPALWLWRRDRRRLRPGFCVGCGYDLTGNTSGICSECGEKMATAKRELIGEMRK